MSFEDTLRKVVEEVVGEEIRSLEQRLAERQVNDPYPRVLTIKEAAEIMRVSEQRMRDIANHVVGFPAIREEGKNTRIKIPKEKFYQWLDNTELIS
ncbi:helix-turn-helix domain-containing protein [Geomicrobium sediminis]|uniref:DNA-binding protein n=1 Tax=Geomicrobium sediminis TaxID=1347788 RepID=A0ABS2PFJ1_9BACL|nr:helix-turn-helix domain-containing protein [Geomicrobium sediminis]MBM7634032.1 hypothetical protein [Geomicrobium sediminis]